MTSYDRYSAIRDRLGYTDYRVAKATGIGTATLSNWKSGKYQPKADKISLIAKYLNVTPEEITGTQRVLQVFSAPAESEEPLGKPKEGTKIQVFEGNPNKVTKVSDLFSKTIRFSLKIPVLGRVAAGSPIEAYEEIIDWVNISEEMARDGEYFGLMVKGDSMEPKISHGDTLIVRRQDDADDGDIVIALVNGNDAVCKRLKKYADGAVALVSTNPAYAPIYFSGEEVAETPVRIIGRVKELRAKL